MNTEIEVKEVEIVSKKEFSNAINEMKISIIESLSKLGKGYGKRKWAIEEETGIPIDILTVLLKQLKNEGKIELIMLWSESKGTPNGSGYCLKGNLSY